ncbi:MAG: hypothetical protein R3D26_24130 [Cyanobacteriota/Melainabacteria group bacterium]
MVQPVSAALSGLRPAALQVVAGMVPAAHVFEGMRALMTGNEAIVWGHLGSAFLLNLLYLAGAGLLFRYSLRASQRKRAWQNTALRVLTTRRDR